MLTYILKTRAKMPYVELTFRVRAKYYRDGTRGTLSVYIPRSYCDRKYPDPEVPIEVGRTATIKLWVPEMVPAKLPVLVRWMIERKMLNGEHVDDISKSSPAIQKYYTLAGCCSTLTLEEVESDKPKAHDMYDITNTVVGSITMAATAITDGTVTLLLTDGSGTNYTKLANIVRRYTKLVKEQEEAKLRRYGTNITYLPATYFSVLQLPTGEVPRWVFPNDTYYISGISSYNTVQAFMGLLDIAKLSFKSSPSPSSLSSQCELLCNMVLAPTRHLLYVTDSTRRVFSDTNDDEWAHLGHRMKDGAMGDDCEDAASETMELFFRFVQLDRKFITDDNLRNLHVIANQYEPLFCIGTIKTNESSYTYHSFILLVDRWSIQTKVGIISEFAEKTDLLPTCLLEGTNYTTSCWDYKDGGSSEREDYDKLHVNTIIEPITFIPNSLMNDIYMHVCTAYAPALFKTNGISRLDFIQNDKYGAYIHDVMRNFTSACYLVTHYSKNHHSLYELLPRIDDGDDDMLTSDIGITKIESSHIPRDYIKGSYTYDLCYRMVDWTPDLYSDILKKTKAKYTQVYHLVLPGGERGIRVRCYE
jgi:hypothetical protein